jgi:hypothetical protein
MSIRVTPVTDIIGIPVIQYFRTKRYAAALIFDIFTACTVVLCKLL